MSTHTLYVGDTNNLHALINLLNTNYKTMGLVEVQADGNELEQILKQFKDLPHNPDRRVHIWYGDLAKTILANLTL
jgi:phosphotransferase system HPr-like phosphotransfer protein